MKILFILPEFYPHSGGGISTYYLHYIKSLKSEVDEICVMVGSGYTQSDDILDVDGIRIEYLKPSVYKSYLHKFSKYDLTPEYRNNIAAAWAMWQQSTGGAGFDIIECTDFGLGFVPWLVNHRVPVVVRLHGSTGQIDLYETHFKTGLSADLHRQAELILLSHADKLISHSSANKTYWENILKKNVDFVPAIFNNEQNFVPLSKKENYGIVCGRIQDWKGPEILCKAIELLKVEKPIIKWYGRDTSYDGKIDNTVHLEKSYPKIWGKQILPQKPLPNHEINKIQQQAKFAIIPSKWDMFNFTGLEYLSAGTVLICSEKAGVSELIENGINGFKYSNNEPLELANCIETVLKLDETEYKLLVENAKKTMLQKLEDKKVLNTNMQIYQNLLNLKIYNKGNLYLNELFKPTDKEYDLNDLLKNISLKKLLNYTLARTIKKI